MSDPATALTSHVPEGHDHRELKANGQQLAYVVLTAEERAKGFVRPYRESYVHVGKRPKHQTRELTAEEKESDDAFKYVLFEVYPESESPSVGKFWTDAELNSGCNTSTRMSRDIAETYARKPEFYGGTFCHACGKHLPLDEFVWQGTAEQVGS